MLFEARGDGSEVFELVEETFDQISEAIKVGTEDGDVDAPRHGFDVGPCATIGEVLTESVAIVTSVRQQSLAGTDALEHVGGASSVVGLAFAQFQPDRIAVGVDHRMDFGRQSAARAPHASGCSDVPRRGDVGVFRPPFLTFAAC